MPLPPTPDDSTPGVPIRISIVIPARNEAQDIRETLERCLAIEYPNREIIVVDDSTDETPAIVREYADRGVRLIHRDKNVDACCGARNHGMREATGEVIVLLNADAVPAPDFLTRVAEHYAQGADWLLVRSRVKNTDTLWGQYLFAHERVTWEGRPFEPLWSEGASFRRTAAEAVGFIPGHFPVRFCRDNMLGTKLHAGGFEKHVDASIPMEHIVPDSFSSFWHHRVWRGTMTPPNFFYFSGKSVPTIIARESIKAVLMLAMDALLVPRLWRARRYVRYVGGWRRLPAQAFAATLDDVAYLLGELKAIRSLVREEGLFARAHPPAAAR